MTDTYNGIDRKNDTWHTDKAFNSCSSAFTRFPDSFSWNEKQRIHNFGLTSITYNIHQATGIKLNIVNILDLCELCMHKESRSVNNWVKQRLHKNSQPYTTCNNTTYIIITCSYVATKISGDTRTFERQKNTTMDVIPRNMSLIKLIPQLQQVRPHNKQSK